jgi:hypothetical protein
MTTPRKFRPERFPREFIREQLVSCPMESDYRIEFRSVAKTLHQAKDPPASPSAWEMIEATAPRRFRLRLRLRRVPMTDAARCR